MKNHFEVGVKHMARSTLCRIKGLVEEEGSEQSNHSLVRQEVQGQELYYKPMSPTQQGLGVIGQFRPSRSFWGAYTNRSPRLQQSPRVGDFALQHLWTGAAHIYALASSGWDSKL